MGKISIYIMFFGFFSVVSLFLKPMVVNAQVPNVSNYMIPVIFYPKDGTPPSQQIIDGVTKSVADIKAWFGSTAGRVEFAPVKVLQGTGTVDSYYNGNPGGCPLGLELWCNINLELLDHEISQAAIGTTDTGFGWNNRIPLIFFSGAPLEKSDTFHTIDKFLGIKWGSGWRLPNGGGRNIISQITTDGLTGNNSECLRAMGKFGVPDSEITHYNLCTEKFNKGVIAHELGHALGLPHVTRTECLQNSNIMCTGDDSLGGQDSLGVANYPSAFFNADQIVALISGRFVHPLDRATSGNFCFDSVDITQWCTYYDPNSIFNRTGMPQILPLPLELDTFTGIASKGTALFKADWSLATFRSQICATGNTGLGSSSGTMNLTASISGTQVKFTMNPAANSAMALLVYNSSNQVVHDSGALADGKLSYTWNSPFPNGTYHARVFAFGTTAFSNTVTFAFGCQDFANAGTNLYKDWSNIASLVPYTAHIDISPDGGANWYGWENKYFGIDCYGPISCSARLNWAAPDYHVNIPAFGASVIKTHPTASYTFPSVPANTSYLGNTYFNDLDNFGNAHNVASYTGTTPFCVSAPTAPRSLGSSLSGSAGSQSANMTWVVPTSWGNECSTTGTRYYRARIGSSNPPKLGFLTTTNTNYAVGNLAADKTVYFQVAAVNKAGLVGPYSSVRSFTTLPVSSPMPTPTPTPTSTPTPTPTPTPNPIACTKLDVNDDLGVDLQDTQLVLKHFGESGPSPYDVNDDGGVDITDAMLVNKAFGMECK